jgi:hypothetical protein
MRKLLGARPRIGKATVLCLFLLTACKTVTEFRQAPPDRTATVRGSYLPLATCTMGRVASLQTDEGVRYQFLDVPSTRTARILGVARMPGGLFYTVPDSVIEFAFKEAGEGNVIIEARNGYGGQTIEPRFWRLVEECAGTKVMP